MRQRFVFIVVLVVFILFSAKVYAQTKAVDTEKILLGASYVADMGRNFTGGLQSGNFYMGMLDMGVEIHPFKNGQFYFQIENTHGNTPSANYVGDLQVFSNIENGDYSYLYMAWYQHRFGDFWMKVGVHDLNSDFAGSVYGCLFTNSSFGISPATSLNMPVPIFPKNALGAVLSYDVTDWFRVKTSLYDGDPLSLDVDPYGTDFHLDVKEEGLLSVSEFAFSNMDGEEVKGEYKLGFQYHSASFKRFDGGDWRKGNWGLYAIADQKLNEHLAMFFQYGYSPGRMNLCEHYAGIGLSVEGVGSRECDAAGIAFAHMQLSEVYRMSEGLTGNETVVEASYRLQLNELVGIQPVLQYVVNPGAVGNSDALIGFVRLSAVLSQVHENTVFRRTGMCRRLRKHRTGEFGSGHSGHFKGKGRCRRFKE